MDAKRVWPSPQTLRRIARVAAGLMLFYVTLLALVVPPIARAVVQKKLTAALHRRTTIRRIVINPFTLSLSVRGFELRDRDGGPFVAFDELYVNLQLMSLVRRGAIVREVTLTRPAITVVRETQQRYSISDLLEPDPNAPPSPPEEKSSARYSVNNIRIVGGSVDFVDKPMHVTHTIRELNVAVPFVSDLPYDIDAYVQPAFAAVIDGTQVNLGARSKPFSQTRETSIELNLDDISLARYVEYVPVALGFTVPSATFNAALEVQFAQRDAEQPMLTVSGKLALKDVAVDDRAGHPVLRLGRVAVEVAPSQPLAQKIAVAKLDIERPELWIKRAHDGRLNLVDLIPAPPAAKKEPAPKPEPTKDEPPLLLTAEAVHLGAGTLHVTDAAPGGPFAATVSGLDVAVHRFSTAPGTTASIDVKLTTDGGERLSDHTELTLSPLRLAGHVALDAVPLKRYAPYYRPEVLVDLDGGTLDVAADYDVRLEKTPAITIKNGAVSLAALKLRRRGEAKELVGVNALALRGIDVDVAKRTLVVGDVTTRGGRVSLVRGADGLLNVASLTPPPKPGAPSLPKPANATPGAPWSVALAHAGIEQWTLRFEDRQPSEDEPVIVTTEIVSASLSDFSSLRGSRAKLSLRTRINKTGALTLSGSVVPDPLAANLRVDGKALDLVPLQPYFADRVNLLVTSGAVSFGGNLALADNGKGLGVRYQGHAGIDHLITADADDSDTLLKWDALYVAGIDANTSPLAVGVAEVSLSQFYARLAVGTDGKLNIKRVAATPPPSSDAAAADAKPAPPPATATPPASATATASATASAPRPPIKIAKVTLQGGTIDYSDAFVRPNFSTSLSDVGGRITGLSSEAGTVADLDLRGKLAGIAPLEISGKVNPLAKELALDLSIIFRDIELSALSPYSGKYAGYTISKGKLTLELKYDVQKRQLAASNKLFLDQLTLGDRVQSKEATKLPVKLALAVLRDTKGEIHLDLPISGSLDDPKFRVGHLIVQVLLNVVVKAATEPFALLGALFGRGPELSYLEFAAGHADVDAPAADKLRVLTKMLNSRPGLKLEITGHVGMDADREGLRRLLFERKVKAQKVRVLAKQGVAGGDVDEVKIAPDEYERYLLLAYKEEKFPKPRNAIGLVKDVPASEMEKLMLTHIVVDNDQLRLLAEKRAETARQALATAGIAPERIFVMEPKTLAADKRDKARDTRIDFSIR